MFELVSKSRQRKCVVFEMVAESVPSRRTGMIERASSVCRQSDSWDVQLSTVSRSQMLVTDDA